MKTKSILEEEKILEILKEFYQVSHVDLKKNVLLGEEKGNINNANSNSSLSHEELSGYRTKS